MSTDFQINKLSVKKGSRNVKCPVCERMNEKEHTVTVESGGKKRYCCPGCVDRYVENLKKTEQKLCHHCKKAFQLKNLTSTNEVVNGVKKDKKILLCPTCYKKHLLSTSERARLIETVCNIFGYYDPPQAILYQIEVMKNTYDFFYEEMRQALVYYFLIKENPVTSESGVGIIPFIYKESQEFFEERDKITQRNKEFDKPLFEKQVVEIRPEPHNPRMRKFKPIDMTLIKEQKDDNRNF